MAKVLTEPREAYDARRQTHLTAHRLATFRRCPRLFRDMELGIVADRDTDSYAFGRAAHTLILEGRDAYRREYEVGGPINPKTGSSYGRDTKAFAEYAAQCHRQIVTTSDAADIERMALAVNGHKGARGLLDGLMVEQTIIYDIGGTPMQSRVDAHMKGLLVDLKTNRNIETFMLDVRRYGYAHQMAVYAMAMRAAYGSVPSVYLIAVEKRQPWRVGTFFIDTNILIRCMSEVYTAVGDYRVCRVNDEWPTGYEEQRRITHDDIFGTRHDDDTDSEKESCE